MLLVHFKFDKLEELKLEILDQILGNMSLQIVDKWVMTKNGNGSEIQSQIGPRKTPGCTAIEYG